MLKDSIPLTNFNSDTLQKNHAKSPALTEVYTRRDTISVVYIRYLGTSMDPTFQDADLLEVTASGKNEIRIGDVIAFRTYYCEDYTVHRVIEVERRGIKTRGDSNDSVDPFWVQPHHIVGKVHSLWRGQRPMNVLNGMAGLVWSYFIHAMRGLDQAISPKIHTLYHSLSLNNDILRLLPEDCQPQVQRFNSDGRAYYKIVIRGNVVGCYCHDLGEWRIKRPYRLVVSEEKLGKIGEGE
jgi:signal peptidase I